jgi:hypothetical protein
MLNSRLFCDMSHSSRSDHEEERRSCTPLNSASWLTCQVGYDLNSHQYIPLISIKHVSAELELSPFPKQNKKKSRDFQRRRNNNLGDKDRDD